MNPRAALIYTALALTGGCASTETKTATAERPGPAPGQLAPVAGTQLDQANVAQVRHSDALKAYPVNRYVDPNDPQVMHEGHVIYRREQAAGWNLAPNAPTVVPLGPTLAVADGAKQPHPLPAELEQKMAEQNQLMATLIEQNESLTKELTRLNQEIVEMRQRGSFATKESRP